MYASIFFYTFVIRQTHLTQYLTNNKNERRLSSLHLE